MYTFLISEGISRKQRVQDQIALFRIYLKITGPKWEKFGFIKGAGKSKGKIPRLLKCSEIVTHSIIHRKKYSNKIKRSGKKDFDSTRQSTNISIIN